MRTFNLEKYYFDAVDAQGQTFIGYSARLHYLGLSLCYAQSLFLDQNKKAHLATSFKNHEKPEVGEAFRCTTKLYQMSAEPLTGRSFGERLYHQTDLGYVEWHCIGPAQDIRVTIKNQRNFVGQGYIEKLTMTIKPWHLPIDALIWGRFIGRKHSAVWIHWEHSQVQSWLFINGHKQSAASITNSFVHSDHWHLALSNESTLIACRPFKEHTKLVGMLTPSSMRHMHEQKWLAKGHLTAGDEEDQGWVIHERVTFKES